MSKNNTIDQISVEVSKALTPLKTYVSSPEDFSVFMRQLGWNMQSIPAPIVGIATDIDNVISELDVIIGGNATSSDYINLRNAVSSATQNIRNLSNSTYDLILTAENFASKFPQQILDYIVINHINLNHYAVSAILEFLGIITYTPIQATANRPFYILKEIRWTRISHLFSQPQVFFQDTYSWGTNNFDSDLLFKNLAKLVSLFGIYPTLEEEGNEIFHALGPNSNSNHYNNYSLSLSLFDLMNNNLHLRGNLRLISLPADGTSLPGLGLLPVVIGGMQNNIEISHNIRLTVGANLDITGGVVLVKRPQEPFVVKTGFGAGSLSIVTGSFDIALVNENRQPTIVIGTADGSRIEYEKLSIGVHFEVNSSSKNELRFEIDLKGLKLVISKTNSDSFVNKILPENGIAVEADLTLGYSTLRGFYFQGSGGLEYQLPTHVKLGPVSIDNILLSLKYSGSLRIATTADFSVSLGPLELVVKNIGMKGSVILGSGGIGGIGFNLGFKPPTGVGIQVKASTVTGGGFLNYDEDKFTYTGGLELKFSKISLSAIGILTTKMPDGSNGYSLLIIITAEFTPIQLGMGFTLNGVGGLLGLHRTINVERLKSGVKDKTLDSILFPHDIVKNASAIISNLSQVFPVKKDRFLIGPMAKLGWGTPTLITIELGVIIEMPSPILLAIVGIVKVILPAEASPVLKLQINFVGIVDFEKKQLSFDASLYDSSLLSFPLTGDMALRLYWGEKPNFLMSVGGFHPKFTPPPMNLPQLQRLALQLAKSDNLSIRVETYFAITSNSVQFGARVDARARAWKIEAIGALWFDILFQFSPFHFTADMGAMFEIRKGGDCILSIYMSLTLEGPGPWRVQGEGSFKIAFVKVHVSFDKTFGQAQTETIAPVTIHQKLIDAIQSKDNWQVIGPDRSHQVTAFRDITGTTGSNLVVDPFGTLVLSQKVAPMGIRLAKFGTSAISDVNQFQISGVTVGTGGNTVPLGFQRVKDFFAPNSFFYLTDDEKLSKDSYEKYDSGVSIGASSEIQADYFVHKEIAYDEIILDSRQRIKFQTSLLSKAEFALHTMDNYITAATISDTRKNTPFGGPAKLAVQDFGYVIADKNTLSQAGGYQAFGSKTEADIFLNGLAGSPGYNDYMVVHLSEI
ncbi:hypothetical protein IC235_18420 [Hymenobacter sp. BT664]|uniref:DUF6603 domain-containing protein n=1 Tax=Hymenobacter montanus TaxID=2771359 RepID=A0A927GL65_9BACT|nr:DUF6603 domain-containing protein [Hymenobacter montanus]MBD2769869.1 hypothetical protein [Hymenobacter montanus]